MEAEISKQIVHADFEAIIQGLDKVIRGDNVNQKLSGKGVRIIVDPDGGEQMMEAANNLATTKVALEVNRDGLMDCQQYHAQGGSSSCGFQSRLGI